MFVCVSKPHFIRHNTPHPKDLRTRHARLFAKTVTVTSHKPDNVREVCCDQMLLLHDTCSHDVLVKFFWCRNSTHCERSRAHIDLYRANHRRFPSKSHELPWSQMRSQHQFDFFVQFHHSCQWSVRCTTGFSVTALASSLEILPGKFRAKIETRYCAAKWYSLLLIMFDVGLAYCAAFYRMHFKGRNA